MCLLALKLPASPASLHVSSFPPCFSCEHEQGSQSSSPSSPLLFSKAICARVSSRSWGDGEMQETCDLRDMFTKSLAYRHLGQKGEIPFVSRKGMGPDVFSILQGRCSHLCMHTHFAQTTFLSCFRVKSTSHNLGSLSSKLRLWLW